MLHKGDKLVITLYEPITMSTYDKMVILTKRAIAIGQTIEMISLKACHIMPHYAQCLQDLVYK